MQKKSFPKSYPYSNKHGISITKEEINHTIVELFRRLQPKSLEFGLELSYILLWAMEKLEHKDSFYRLTARLFARVVNRQMSYEKTMARKHVEIDENYVDQSLLNLDERILSSHSLSALVGEGYELEELMDMDRRRRHREMRKIRQALQNAEVRYD